MALREPTRIVMVGTSPSTHGGIASVVQALREAGLFARWPVDYIESHCDAPWAVKGLCALGAYARFAAMLVRHRCAILHVHAASRASFWRKSIFIAMARVAGWPYVIHLHGGGFARFRGEAPAWQRRLIDAAFANAARVITVSKGWSRWVRDTVPSAHVSCIPNPAPVMPTSAIAREAGLVAFVGRCEAAKGVLDLVDAMGELHASHPHIRLECAGDGDLDAVARHARDRGLRSRVDLRGWVGRRERAQLMARAAIFALPSHAEGLPVSLLEAMAAGCAVVASRVGGIPDVVEDGMNGLLVPPGDARALAFALQRLLDDPALAARLGREAKASIARNHTPQLALARLGLVYTALGVRRETPARPAAARGLREVA